MGPRTPAEAFERFIEPIQQAAATLGTCKITPSPGGRTEPNIVHAWTINRERGFVFPNGWRFEAQMHYEILQRPVSLEWKISTLGYRYQLSLRGYDQWRIHWHPKTNSRYHGPHLHLNLNVPGDEQTESLKQHFPTSRMTFEDAIEWVFNSPITPAREDYLEVLNRSRARHVQHRTWHTRPPESSSD